MHTLASFTRKLAVTVLVAGTVFSQAWAAPQAPTTISGDRAKQYLDIVNDGRNEEDLVTLPKLALRESRWSPAILVGFVTDTQHVLLGGVIVNQKNYNLRQASALLFEGAGWANASAEAKDQLVLRFVNDIILGFDETLVTQLPAKFPKTDKKTGFKPPSVTATPTGGRVFEGWILENPAASSNTIYRRSVYLFGARGELIRSRQLDRVVLE
jgi:hypothetical protein